MRRRTIAGAIALSAAVVLPIATTGPSWASNPVTILDGHAVDAQEAAAKAAARAEVARADAVAEAEKYAKYAAIAEDWAIKAAASGKAKDLLEAEKAAKRAEEFAVRKATFAQRAVDLQKQADELAAKAWEKTYGFRYGVVSVSDPMAAKAGYDMLAAGGNAIDAAASIQFALNVVEPQFSGIGGGGFMMVHLGKTGETIAVDSREKAPYAAGPDLFVGATSPASNGVSVGVPGTLLGVATALEKWGTRPLADTLQAGIKLADEGFTVSPWLASSIASSATNRYPETAAIYRPGGTALRAGDTLRNPDLAKAFRLIAEQGTDAFYKGEIAEAIVEAQKKKLSNGRSGVMTLDDLARYDVKLREPSTGTYRGYEIASMSPPSSGGLTILQMLGMLERFPMGDESQGFGFGSTKTLNVMAEAMRVAYADRAVWMGDEDYVPMPKKGLLHPEYVASRSALINPDSRISPNPTAGDPWAYEGRAPLAAALVGPDYEEHGTTHFTVADRWGNIVSYTTTIEAGWGTGITVPGYGFLLNNELTDFNLTPTFDAATGNPGANDVAPGKRPRSSMAPTMIFKDGKPYAAFGSPGGATIINSVLQVAINLIDHKMNIQQAIDAPRISVTAAGGSISREAGFSDAAIQGLRALGHTVGNPGGIGSVQGIVFENGKQYGGADNRREGTVYGFR